jgi:hypothetical protein
MISVSAAVGLLASLHAAPVPAPASGAEVIRAMYQKYHRTWYRRLSFVQRAIWSDGRPEEEWWEAMQIPGRLRIDVAPVDSSPQTIVYRGDSLYVFARGKRATAVRQPNLLLVLGFDVYRQAPDSTIALLERERFDLQQVHEETWESRPVYVIGAARGDLTSNQIWIDRERLVFLRLIQQRPKGGPSDIRFTEYQPLGGGWIGTVVRFFSEGKETFTEIYRDWKIDPAITDELFQVDQWRRPAWVTAR